MRPFRLARIAAEAEGVRLRGMVQRIVTRLVMAVIALLFVIGAVVFAHIAAWVFIRATWDLSPLITAGCLGGGDLVIAVLLGLLASRSTPSSVEVEALAVRRKAVESIVTTASITRLALPAVRVAAGAWSRNRRAGA